MRTKFFIILAFACCVGFSAYLLGVGRAQERSDNQGQVRKLDVSDESYPIVDLLSPNARGEKDNPIRAVRNRRFNHVMVVKDPKNLDVTLVSLKNHWDSGLASIPTAQSDAVLVGKVLDSSAYLSDDLSGVYSEFNVSVNTVIKNDLRNPINVDSTATVDRFGGRVRFPSGQIIKYVVSGQRMPEIGKEYLFFLDFNEGSGAFQIMTAYGFEDNQVRALDGSNATKGNVTSGNRKWAVDSYNGFDKASFIAEVYGSLSSPLEKR